MTEWPMVKLGDAALINPRWGKLTDQSESVDFVGMADLDDATGEVRPSSQRTVLETKTGYTQFARGDILIAKITPCFENCKIGQASISTDRGAGSTEFHVVRPDADRLNARYLLHFLRQPWVRETGVLRMTGSGGQRRVPVKFVSELQVPLPPLPEQRRIADILDRADGLRKQRARIDGLVGRLGPAIFNQMFSTRNEDSVLLGDIAAIDSGITKGRKLKSDTVTREMPYLAVANVQDRHLRLDEVKTLAVTDSEIERYRLKTNDLLLTEGGDPDKLGRGVLWDASVDVMLHQNHIFRVRLHEDAPVSPMFLSWAVAAPASKQYFLRQAKQTTGIATINKRQLSRLPVPVPEIADQSEFARRISVLSRQQNLATKSAIEVEAQFSSLQSRAFRGEL